MRWDTVAPAPAIATAVAALSALSATISVASATIPAAAVTAAVTSVASAVSTSTVATSVASAAFSSTSPTSVASAASPSTFSATSVAAAERPAAASAGTPGLHVPLLKHMRLLGLERGMQRWRAGIRRRVRAVRARHGLHRLRSTTCGLPPSHAAPAATALSAAATASPGGGDCIGLHEHVRSPMEWRVRRRRPGRRVHALLHRDRLHRLRLEACTSSLPPQGSPFAPSPFAATAAFPGWKHKAVHQHLLSYWVFLQLLLRRHHILL